MATAGAARYEDERGGARSGVRNHSGHRDELGPKRSVAVLIIIVGCFAVLWPKLLSPLFGFGHHGVSTTKNPKLSHPRHHQKQPDLDVGCCDVVWENDINAIKIMTELCNNFLKTQNNLDWKTQNALATGKLTAEIVTLCKREVNATCGVDISSFLDHNIRLGKSYKQILDEVRSYNSSSCLKRNYGVAPWSLGVPHLVGKFWMQGVGKDSIRQERPSILRMPPMHPALKERGRAIPTLPDGVVPQTIPIVQKGPMEGRVWSSPLSVYFVKQMDEPLPIGGMRPPMGGAGGVIPPPKSSVGFLMPVYTLCIVVFFMYTIFKMLFRRTGSGDSGQYEPIKSDPEFRRKVFNDSGSNNRASSEGTKLGHKERDTRDEELDQLKARLAETERAMERIMKQMRGPLIGQDINSHPYTNGRVHNDKIDSLLSTSKDSSSHKENTPPSWESEVNSTTLIQEISKELDKIMPEEKLNEQEDELVRQIRSSVEKEKAAVKVVGMEITAHPEGGRRWTTRPVTPPVAPLPLRPPTPVAEVSSIILEGHLPHVSRILVTDSEISTEELKDGEDKDSPIILSGKMTLSVINDESSKTTPERDNAIIEDSIMDGEDDEYLTASAATAPKQTGGDFDEDSEEELEEEVEEEEEEIVEVEETEEVEEEEEEEEN